ncbi:MAG: putative outer membrane protein, partial [Paucimonas sp.]|nr:putative outer membrane protein [Paucimonas sp.]
MPGLPLAPLRSALLCFALLKRDLSIPYSYRISVMKFEYSLTARAVFAALSAASFAAHAHSPNDTMQEVVVTATPFQAAEESQILAPAKVVSGAELRDKLGGSLGDTLSNELGVSASAFGAGASRPIIRGMEGPRVKILENGMSVSDVSTLSNDHEVATDAATAHQIEILRGPAALLYGSGAIGGLVNVVNHRIPTFLTPRPTGDAEIRYGSVDKGKHVSFSADGASGPIGLHADGSYRDADDYRIPGHAQADDLFSPAGTLPSSFSRTRSAGLGASYIETWGHIGFSVSGKDDRYGIPTDEKAFITLKQNRTDFSSLVKNPFAGFDTLKFKLAHTDYQHTENEEDGTPATDFKNRATETRVELGHAPMAGWKGIVGLQTERNRYSALAADGSGPETVPVTRSTTAAAFIVEEREFATGTGPLRVSTGARWESVKRRPDAVSGLPGRDFTLGSYSLGGLWTFVPGYGLGLTGSVAQRAPATEELYSNGPHESTATFDIGDAALRKETSRNMELSLQKTTGAVRWKANLFENRAKNFIYGLIDGTLVDDSGAEDPAGEFTRRFWSQGGATIRGAEAEITFRPETEGPAIRLFADTSRGKLTDAGSLPLQPATRIGLDLNYRSEAWRSGLAVVHALKQDRLASFESFVTPAYTRVDINLAYTQRLGQYDLTWFGGVRNLLNR